MAGTLLAFPSFSALLLKISQQFQDLKKLALHLNTEVSFCNIIIHFVLQGFLTTALIEAPLEDVMKTSVNAEYYSSAAGRARWSDHITPAFRNSSSSHFLSVPNTRCYLLPLKPYIDWDKDAITIQGVVCRYHKDGLLCNCTHNYEMLFPETPG